MSLTADQISRIRDRLPGWEKDWGQLCVLLLGEDGESGALVRAVNRLGVVWPKESVAGGEHHGPRREGPERDDFISWMIGDFHRRAVNGTLLVGYDPTRGDVVAFLTAKRPLYIESVRFLERLAARQLKSIDDLTYSSADEPESQQGTAAAFDSLIAEVQEELQNLTLEGIARITRVVEQAALQLFPRLNWSRPTMAPLREHLIQILRSNAGDADPLTVLSQSHEEADKSFDEQLEQVSAKIHNDGRGVSFKTRARLERQYGAVYVERVFFPLNADALVRLLGIKQSDAAQQRHRYRESLPEMLPRLGSYYEILRELRLEASEGESP